MRIILFAVISIFSTQVAAQSIEFDQWDRLTSSRQLAIAADLLFEMVEGARSEETPAMLVELDAEDEENQTGQIAERYALITYRLGPELRSGHFLSIYYLAWVDGRLGILDDKMFPDILEMSTFSEGEFLESRKTGQLLTAPSILVTSGPTWQGCGYETTDIIALLKQGPRKVASVPTKFSNFSGNNDIETVGVILNGKPGKGFIVSYTGNVDRRVVWLREGAGYAPYRDVDIGSC